MDFSSLLAVLGNTWIDEFLIWTVASVAAVIGIVAIVNALEMVFESEAG